MSMESPTALVLRTTDWSETSRIATLWTRELGKVRVLAKGGRRLKSIFDSALDLLTVCGIVLLRKSSGSLDLLTEAQVVRRFARLRDDLSALYAAYYVAELLADWTEELDPHPDLFDEAVATLDELAHRRARTCRWWRALRDGVSRRDGLSTRPRSLRRLPTGAVAATGRSAPRRAASCARPVGRAIATLRGCLAGGVAAPGRSGRRGRVAAADGQRRGRRFAGVAGRLSDGASRKPPRLLPYLGG